MSTSLLRFVARRLLSLPLVLIGITVVTFALMHLVPGDPVRLLLGEGATDPKIIAALRRQWGLDRPLHVQYLHYLKNLARGELGVSIRSGRPVAWDLARYLPATVELGALSFLITLVLGIPLGVLSGARANTLTDHASRLSSLLFLSMPSFWFGLILVYIGYYQLGVLPTPTGRLGMGEAGPPTVTGLHLVDSLLAADSALFLRALWHLLPPAFTLALASVGLVVRLLRSSMVEILNQDYIRTAWAKGLPSRAVFYIHALRNALIPTVTVLGIQFGSLFGGNVLIETVFAWPGVGLYFVESIQWLDYAPVLGATVLIATAFVSVNFLVDLTYAILDPRIRYQ
ncbi:MAG: ABC transporter permease [Armatimonadota bacterium]|nr:ABC transporter permease [Armatimonadota bacterium]